MIDFTYNSIILTDYKSQRERTSLRSLSLLRNLVLGDSLTDIAKDSGVSIAMISKHKQNALKIIKERMSGNHEKAEKDRSAGGYHFGCDQR